jgi:putative ATP-dependent endonuclease of OLD family
MLSIHWNFFSPIATLRQQTATAMRISRLRIKNFRSIKELELELGETTVFIGPNNAGKTAILDAIRIALTRRWGQRGTGFSEYDVHLANETDDPKKSPGIEIEIRLEESQPDEWPEAIQQDLDEIIQTDPATGQNSITLLARCAWDAAEKAFLPSWQFLNAARSPLAGGSARRINLEKFWQYLPVFYLNALRDAEDEFSAHSQFWGKLLKAMEIPEPLEKLTQRVLDFLNKKLLAADPRLAQIAATLTGVTRIAASEREGGVDLRVVPLKAWDILSKAQIILRNESDRPWLPLQNHGQGVQSLSVIFLFQAFVEQLLKELYEADSSPVLALEEPETHLHPQAARTLWKHIRALSGQKCITTHSPFFVAHVPFRDLRLVRLTAGGTEVKSLPATFSATVPNNPAFLAVVAAAPELLKYDHAPKKLTVFGKLDQATYRKLIACFTTPEDRAAVHPFLRKLYDDSKVFVTDGELHDLETFAMRIRGEIFFARKWLLVEGQAEYLLMHALGRALGYDLDEHGIAVIDAVNNGNPITFAVLARALGIPWKALFDGDAAGNAYTSNIAARDFEPAEITLRCANLPGTDLEGQFVADGFEPEMRVIMGEIGVQNAAAISPAELTESMRRHKTDWAARLAARMATDPALAPRFPKPLRDLIEAMKTLT